MILNAYIISFSDMHFNEMHEIGLYFLVHISLFFHFVVISDLPFSDQFHNTLKSLHALLYPLCIVFYPIMFIYVCTVLEFFIIMQCPIARLL